MLKKRDTDEKHIISEFFQKCLHFGDFRLIHLESVHDNFKALYTI